MDTPANGQHSEGLTDILPVSGMYENWFLDYASYVILERAVPDIADGFKPVQRRILHAMYEMDDGRFSKVANIIGSTMQYHPHGDASIGDAIVNIGQKDLLIETQGNWGDIRTGDGAAAPRYIEARLSKFAHEVTFNPQTTEWQASYDGRKREPVTLPVKFPLLLAQGVEGIAVGLSTKILPHNFCELIAASIDLLKGKTVELFPDFPTGGMADVTNYNAGGRGSRIRVRARIESTDNKTLLIREIPFGTTTSSVCESIVKANDAGKIKIKKVTDNTAKDVEIEVQLAPGQSPDVAIDALYAFTDCEVSLSPNACVIVSGKPIFLNVQDILRISTDRTVALLRQELEIRRHELQEKILFSSLEKIFIEQRLYRQIEECETWEAVLSTIDKSLDPYKPQFYRQINQDDILRLTEIKIKRISRYDSFKADEAMRALEKELAETEHHLAHLIPFAIRYFQDLLKKYGKGRERRTEIRTFDTVEAAKVAANNVKLYANRKDGFVGFGLKKDEFIAECSDLDDVIVFLADGKFVVTRIAEKTFVGKNILHLEVFVKNDERRVYNLMYQDGATGITRVKRFQVLGITRDKVYDLTTGTPHSKVLYFTSNPNGEAETVSILLSPTCKATIKNFEFDFAELDIKGRGAQGNILTKYPVKKITFKKSGGSTLGAMDIWFDTAIHRLNTDKRGQYLGKFNPEDSILACYRSGEYELTGFELTNRYDDPYLSVEKFNPQRSLTAVYLDGKSGKYYLKRFLIDTTTRDKKFSFISAAAGSQLLFVSSQRDLVLEIEFLNAQKVKSRQLVDVETFAEVTGRNTLGSDLALGKILSVKGSVQSGEGEEEGEAEGDGQMKLF